MIFLPKPDNVSQEEYDAACAKQYTNWVHQFEMADRFDTIEAHSDTATAMKAVYGFAPSTNAKLTSEPTGKSIGDA